VVAAVRSRKCSGDVERVSVLLSDAKFRGYTESWQRDSFVSPPQSLPELIRVVEGRLAEAGVVAVPVVLEALGLRRLSVEEVGVELGVKTVAEAAVG
jgi:hypothetical protein